jgi:hypothetical protein
MKNQEVLDNKSVGVLHELLQKSLEIETKLQMYRDFQNKQLLEELENHINKHGHLFAVDEKSGAIRRNKSGVPIPLKIPGTVKITHDLIKDLSERTKKLMGDLKSIERSTTPLDMSQFKYLLKPREQK